MPGHYYCRINGDQIGPLSAKKVRDLIQCGVLQDNDAVRKAPHGRWVSVADGKKRFGSKKKPTSVENEDLGTQERQQANARRIAENEPHDADLSPQPADQFDVSTQGIEDSQSSDVASHAERSNSETVDADENTLKTPTANAVENEAGEPEEVAAHVVVSMPEVVAGIDAVAASAIDEPDAGSEPSETGRETGEVEIDSTLPPPLVSPTLQPSSVLVPSVLSVESQSIDDGISVEDIVASLGIELTQYDAETEETAETKNVGTTHLADVSSANELEPVVTTARESPARDEVPLTVVEQVDLELALQENAIPAPAGLETELDQSLEVQAFENEDVRPQPNETSSSVSSLLETTTPEAPILPTHSVQDSASEIDPNETDFSDPPTAESRFKTLLRNQYARAALLVNFVVVPFLVPEFGPNLAPSFSFVFAILSLLVGALIYSMVCLPNSRARGWAFAGAIFIGVFGTSTLIQYEELAVQLAPEDVTIPTSPLWLVQMMGTAFLHLMTEVESGSSSGFLQLLVSAVLSAGFCEETLKLIPVAVAIGTGYVRKDEDKRGVLYIGAICGIGFGISEGLWLTLDDSPGGVSLSSHLTHFLGRAGGHAAFTLVAASLLLFFAQRVKKLPVWKLTGFLVLTGFVLAVPHGLYDALLIYRLPGLAGLMMLSLVWIVLVASDPKLPDSTTTEA